MATLTLAHASFLPMNSQVLIHCISNLTLYWMCESNIIIIYGHNTVGLLHCAGISIMVFTLYIEFFANMCYALFVPREIQFFLRKTHAE